MEHGCTSVAIPDIGKRQCIMRRWYLDAKYRKIPFG